MESYETDYTTDKSPESRSTSRHLIIGGLIVLAIILSIIIVFSSRSTSASTKSTEPDNQITRDAISHDEITDDVTADDVITDRSERLNYLKTILEPLEKIIIRIFQKVNSDQSTDKEAHEMKELLIKHEDDLYVNIREEIKYVYESFSTELTSVMELASELETILKEHSHKNLTRMINMIEEDLQVIITFLREVNDQFKLIISTMEKGIILPSENEINIYVDLFINTIKKQKQNDQMKFSVAVDGMGKYLQIINESISKVVDFKGLLFFDKINNLIGDTLALIKLDNIEESKFLALRGSWDDIRRFYEEVARGFEDGMRLVGNSGFAGGSMLKLS